MHTQIVDIDQVRWFCEKLASTMHIKEMLTWQAFIKSLVSAHAIASASIKIIFD